MPFVKYVPINRAAEMVRAVNNATTRREHRDAQLCCEGYMKRCEELGQVWPGIELDLMFSEVDPQTGEYRPTCCGEFLDWHERLAEVSDLDTVNYIDLSNWDTSNLTDVSKFGSRPQVEFIMTTDWDTSNAKKLSDLEIENLKMQRQAIEKSWEPPSLLNYFMRLFKSWMK